MDVNDILNKLQQSFNLNDIELNKLLECINRVHNIGYADEQDIRFVCCIGIPILDMLRVTMVVNNNSIVMEYIRNKDVNYDIFTMALDTNLLKLSL